MCAMLFVHLQRVVTLASIPQRNGLACSLHRDCQRCGSPRGLRPRGKDPRNERTAEARQQLNSRCCHAFPSELHVCSCVDGPVALKARSLHSSGTWTSLAYLDETWRN